MLEPRPPVPDSPPPEIRYRRALAFGTSGRELWGSRHIIRGLVVRQVRSQYSQQVLGLVDVRKQQQQNMQTACAPRAFTSRIPS
mgnify:CR=1 FL=1